MQAPPVLYEPKAILVLNTAKQRFFLIARAAGRCVHAWQTALRRKMRWRRCLHALPLPLFAVTAGPPDAPFDLALTLATRCAALADRHLVQLLRIDPNSGVLRFTFTKDRDVFETEVRAGRCSLPKQ